MKPLVWIAGPYTNREAGLNVIAALNTAERLWDTGLIVPMVAAASPIIAFPSHHDAVRHDLLERCDAALRAAGPPADDAMAAAQQAEVDAFAAVGLPIFVTEEGLLDWARAWAAGADR